MGQINNLNSITKSLLLYLKNTINKENIIFADGFDTFKRNIFINNAVVTCRIGKVRTKGAGVGDNIGDNLYGKKLEVTLNFNIYVHKFSKGTICQDVFSDIINAFMVRDNGLYIKQIESFDICCDKQSGDLVLPFTVTIDYLVTKEETPIAINEIILRRESKI